MKKMFLLIGFSFICFPIFSQNLLSSNVNDTLSVDALGSKIELESDLVKCEIWNNEILKVSTERKALKTLKSDIRDYYQKAYFFSLINQAYFESERGNIKKEIEYYYTIIKSADEVKYAKVLAFTYNAIGKAFFTETDFVKAEFYFRKAIKLVTPDIDQTVLGQLYNSLGRVFVEQKKYDLALETYFKSLSIKKKINNSNEIAKAYNSIADLYIIRKNYDSATVYLNNGIKEGSKLKQNQLISSAYDKLATVAKEQKNQRLYEQHTERAFDYATKAKDLDLIEKSGFDFYKILEKKEKYQTALKVLKSAISAKDSMNKAENKSAIFKAEFKYETEKKEAQIKDLAQQNKISELESTRKSTLIYSILGGVLALGFVAYFSFTRFKTKKRNELLSNQLDEAERRIEIEQKATESELKALKSQMNPHFMFNALNSIQEQFMFGDKALANEQMGNFTYLTRQILTVSGKKRISLATEVEILNKYLELEKMRFSTDFRYEIKLSHKIDEDYHQIPPMLIQPFVENAIKHGLLHKQGDKKLSIIFDLDETEENLICTVEDNGIGRAKSAMMKTKQKQQHESFSTSATEERLRLLSSQLNSKDLVNYQDLINNEQQAVGTLVTVKIPIG